MNAFPSASVSASLYVNIAAIAALARRCADREAELPGLDDAGIRDFMRMARLVDPRPMLLDSEFDLRYRFDTFGNLVEPLSDLVDRYGAKVDAERGRGDYQAIYLKILTFSIRTLCAGLELLACAQNSATNAQQRARTTLEEALGTFQIGLDLLMTRFTRILEQPVVLDDDEAIELSRMLVNARLGLECVLAR
jgi:hypothetical protein